MDANHENNGKEDGKGGLFSEKYANYLRNPQVHSTRHASDALSSKCNGRLEKRAGATAPSGRW